MPTNYHFYSQAKSCSYAKEGSGVKKTLRFPPTNRVHLRDRVKYWVSLPIFLGGGFTGAFLSRPMKLYHMKEVHEPP